MPLLETRDRIGGGDGYPRRLPEGGDDVFGESFGLAVLRVTAALTSRKEARSWCFLHDSSALSGPKEPILKTSFLKLH
jgi:hypothetical protein